MGQEEQNVVQGEQSAGQGEQHRGKGTKCDENSFYNPI